MKWDYWTYKSQPAIFVSEIWKHMTVEAEAKKGNEPVKPMPKAGRR